MKILPGFGHKDVLPDPRNDELASSHKPDNSRKRKVSETSTPAPKHFASEGSVFQASPPQHFSGDAVYFIESDIQRQQVLERCRQNGQGSVILLRSPADLEHHNLVNTVICQEKGLCHRAPGRLFGGQPLTLVLDLTVMSPGQIASINDLLAQPRSYLGKPLSGTVRLVTQVSPSMLEPGPGKPGPDCWRRLQAFPALYPADEPSLKRLLSKTGAIKSDEMLLQERVQTLLPEQPEHHEQFERGHTSTPETIDFTDGNNWRYRLFGGMALNDRGKLCFRVGQLAGLEAHQEVVLRDAPWNNPDFTAALTAALRECGFEANGVWVPLPDSLRWFRKDTPLEEVELLRQRFVQQQGVSPSPAEGAAPDQVVYLNPVSLEDALCDTQIHDGIPRSEDTLKHMLSDCQALCLTEPLTDTQWLRLLRRLARLDNPPHPIDLTRKTEGFRPVLPKGIRCQFYSNEAAALEKLGRSHKTYRMTAQTQWYSLWQDARLASQNEMRFELRDTPLVQALKEGKPVAFHGLETCPNLMARLESLLAHTPYLFINGQKVTLPKARVTFLWPETATQPESPLWKKVLEQASPAPCPAAAPHPLMTLLENLPPSTRKRYPAKPPWQGKNFNALLTRQVEQERLEDNAPQVLPVHYRKALHTLLVKAYRGDDEMYGYLKFRVRQLHPDVPPETAADRDALKKWLGQHPVIDRSVLKRDFWSLVRHCPVSKFSGLLPDGFKDPDQPALDRLAHYLTGAAEPEQHRALAQSLMVNPEKSSELQYYEGSRRIRLRDALLAAGSQRISGKAISEQVRSLDQSIRLIIQYYQDQEEVIFRTRATLRDHFPNNLLQGDFSDLAEALVLGSRGQRERQQRRMRRLTERVRKYPLVFLQGEAGAGKSHMARAVAEQLRQCADQAPPPQVLSLGPESSAEQLFGQAIIHEDISGDASSEFKPGPVLDWAMSDNPPLLVLDEANLAREGVLAPLAGLMEIPPRINYQGRDYVLNDRHRVILTGNPEYYDGRHMDSTLKKHLLTLYYRPLDHHTLAEFIIRPALPARWPDTLKDQGTEAILSLYRRYAGLLPDALSPRDLQDVLCRISQALRHHQQSQANRDGSEVGEAGDLTVDLSPQHLHQVVLDAFSGSLEGRIAANDSDRVHALVHWYKARFPCDNSLTKNKENAFQTFLEQLRRNNPDIDLNSTPVVHLVQKYWQFLDQQQDQPRGRRSLLVEGPAGWGKDLILNRVLTLWEQQLPAPLPFVHINASPNQWDALVETTRTAMAQGQKLVISELNLLPSRFLEGLFNDVLTSGAAHPDFALFATVNPSSFGGRETLSTALKSRCTQVQLTPLPEPDLRGILVRRTPNPNPPLFDWLSVRYQSLSESLRLRHAPIQLSLDDLFRAADTLSHTAPQDWAGAFKTTFGLALQSVGLTMDELEQRLTESPEPVEDNRSQRRDQLSLYLNKGQPEPLTVRLLAPDADPAWDGRRRILHLPDTADEGALRDMADYILTFYQKPSTEPVVVTGALSGDITSPTHYDIDKFFAGQQFETRDYRLRLKQLVIRDGLLREETLPCDEGGIENIQAPGWPAGELTLGETQQLGSGDFHLQGNRWTPLPGLSALDQLVYIRCHPQQPMEIARGKGTGQLLVRLASTAPDQSARVHLDFILEPDQVGLSPLQAEEPIQTKDGLCDPLLRAELDKALFSPQSRIHRSCQELQAIQKISDKASQLKDLAQWCLTFGCDHDVPGRGLNLLLNIIREKQGVCEHRSQVFQVLSQYFGVPARMVDNASHQYVEYSPDDGSRWRKIDLGGGGVVTKQEYPQHHPENIHLPEGAGVVGLYRSDVVRKQLKQLFKKGIEQKHWPDLTRFLKSPFGKIRRVVGNVGIVRTISHLSPKGEYLYLPWPEILNDWHCHVQAERVPDERSSIQEQLIDEIITVMDVDCLSKFAIPNAHYFETLTACLPLIKQKAAPVEAIFSTLEFLASHQIQEAEQLLEEYYQQLTRPHSWPVNLELEYEVEWLKSVPDLGGHSPTLTKALRRAYIDKQWRIVSTGKAPDLNRMARKQPAFPLSREISLTRPVFFCLMSQVYKKNSIKDRMGLEWFNRNFKCETDEQIEDIENIPKILFLNWLLGHDLKKEWRTLCCFTTAGGQTPHDGTKLTYGCYPSARSLFHDTKDCGYFVMDTTPSPSWAYRVENINPKRIRKAFNEPDALVLDTEFIATCFREYLDSMDLDKLAKFHSSLVKGGHL